ncbi:MAG: oxidoreductase, partial [Brevirhabdus sp.]
MSKIGEVQVTAEFPEKPGNLVLAPGADLTALTALATRGSAGGAQIWPQLGHAGALSHPPLSDPTAPSPLGVEGLNCKAMTPGDIAALPDAYARAADMAKKAGFGGVQIHAGHGFLFSQSLCSLFNHRTDAYVGPVAARFRVIGETIEAVRKAVGPAFPYGIRINATDKLEGGFKTREEALVAMSAGAADAIGLARAMALNPSLANSWL